MKRVVAAVLGTCLLLGVFPFAVAEGEPEENIIAVVGTFEELAEALVIAEDGDTIAISDSITILPDKVVETDKNITLIRDAEFTQYPMFALYKNAILRGFTIIDTSKWPATMKMYEPSSIQDCSFIGSLEHYGEFIVIEKAETGRGEDFTIENCSFTQNQGSAIACEPGAKALIKNCTVNENGGNGVYVNNDGNVVLENCTITNCGNFALRATMGAVTLSGCHIGNNGLWGERRYDLDVMTIGITDEAKENEGYYDLRTGQKIDLPYYGDSDVLWLIYLTDEEAETYFEEPTPTPSEEPEPTHTIEPTPTPTPVSPTPDPTPTLTPEPTPEPTPSLEPIPKPTSSPPPYDPPNDDDDREEEDDPPVVYRPIHTTSKPKQSSEPPKEVLSCGGAKIDPSRSVELLGDEDDPLTRAEMTKLICGLLEDSTPGPEESTSSTFRDVPTNVWYAPYVLYLADIGAVVGVGGECYAPEGETTWAQLLTLLGRFMELQWHEVKNIQCEEWEQPAIENAIARGWIKDEADFSPGAIVTHGEAVSFINRIIEVFK